MCQFFFFSDFSDFFSLPNIFIMNIITFVGGRFQLLILTFGPQSFYVSTLQPRKLYANNKQLNESIHIYYPLDQGGLLPEPILRLAAKTPHANPNLASSLQPTWPSGTSSSFPFSLSLSQALLHFQTLAFVMGSLR